MKVKRVFNNNVLLAVDKKGNEKILLGKGIGWNKRKNDFIDLDEVDKTYILETKNDTEGLQKFINSIPPDILILTKEIVEAAQKSLNVKFDESIYIGLADHISYAVSRAQNGEMLNNAMLWEIKKFYPLEFKMALISVEMIFNATGIRLDENEAGFITIHFVNNQQGGEITKDSKSTTKIIHEIVNIVKFHYKIDFDENSISFSRFITHLRYFLKRIKVEKMKDSKDDFLFLQVKNKYPEAYQCVLKIEKYLNHKLNIDLVNDEKLYFMLHVNRLANREETNDGLVTGNAGNT